MSNPMKQYPALAMDTPASPVSSDSEDGFDFAPRPTSENAAPKPDPVKEEVGYIKPNPELQKAMDMPMDYENYNEDDEEENEEDKKFPLPPPIERDPNAIPVQHRFMPLSKPEVYYVPLPEHEQGRTKEDREKKTFMCDHCDIVLSSVDTLNSHVQGSKHTKMVEHYEADIRRLGVDNVPEREVRQIKNPEPMRRKIPIRLQAKINESTRPVLGLSVVDEFIAESDPEMEPHYFCNLCPGARGEANGMFQHITQSNHQQRFFEAKFEGNPNFIDMPGSVLSALAQHHNENKRVYLIKTYRSDLLFPNWGDGKAPWSVQQGGSGVAPPDSREKVLQAGWKSDHPEWKELNENRKKALMSLKSNVPPRESVGKITSDSEALMYSQFLSQMLDVVCETTANVTKEKKGEEDRKPDDSKLFHLDEGIRKKKAEIQATLLQLELLNLSREEEIIDLEKGERIKKPRYH